jgi:formylglycine-generating enzyme required for sulfatase activity
MSAIHDYLRGGLRQRYPFEFETVRVDERGQIIERKRGRAFAFREPLVDEIGLEMVAIPSGKFMMGSPESEHNRFEDENPQHQVTVPPFFMGKYPVTQAQWHAFAQRPLSGIANTLPVERELDLNSCGFAEDNLPIEDVHWDKVINLPITGVYWDEAIEFCHRLSRDTGQKYRLPTEAEWEYACRAGTQTPFYFGQTITPDLANYRGTDARSANWFLSGTYDSTQWTLRERGPKGIYRNDITPVDTFPPNAFGLYDLHGNVSEWCLDSWHGDYRDAPVDSSAWVVGGDDNVVTRGGSYNTFPGYCRSASRQLQTPARYSRPCTIGFRVVCELPKNM